MQTLFMICYPLQPAAFLQSSLAKKLLLFSGKENCTQHLRLPSICSVSVSSHKKSRPEAVGIFLQTGDRQRPEISVTDMEPAKTAGAEPAVRISIGAPLAFTSTHIVPAGRKATAVPESSAPFTAAAAGMPE